MPAPKGTRPPNAGKGRPKGAANKLSADVKTMILAALDRAGGIDYLRRQADENPPAFMTLLGKVLPTKVTGSEAGPIYVVTGVPRAGDEA